MPISVRLAPVSYTHLDVYKRQGLSSGLVLLDGDHAVGGDLLHRIGDQLADLSVAGRNSTDTGNVLAAVDLLACLLYTSRCV